MVMTPFTRHADSTNQKCSYCISESHNQPDPCPLQFYDCDTQGRVSIFTLVHKCECNSHELVNVISQCQ
eukprot:3021355-Amphidinium_carterae.1